ncbi:MAG TPA: hypothetical protein VL970_14155 [Candidatus Acidoferrales bacterium]|nr:hypothetical protein [Candidatus Acidoferrales bacterium]
MNDSTSVAKSAGLSILLFSTLLSIPLLAAGEDLVPARPGTAPNYWCTWSVQNYMFGIGTRSLDPKEVEGGAGAAHARLVMNESNVFGSTGWVTTFFPRVRGDLYVMYDDGLFRDGTGSFQIDEKKFPFLAGLDSAERMRRLNERTRAAGWRGAALWCRGPATRGEAATNLVLWSRHAGVEYWKIDGGDGHFAFIDLAQGLYPALKLEHIQGSGPFNGNWQGGEVGRFGKYQADWHEGQCLEHSDVFRTYDVSPPLSFPTTLDRVAEALRYGNDHPVRAFINCEDEVYTAATLGCTMGIMRHPLIGLRPDGDIDCAFSCPRQCKRRMDEVVRALRWQRLAPPFAHFNQAPGVTAPVRDGNVTHIDEQILVDAWTFKTGETWLAEAIGKTIRQGAPARVSRGLPLPEVNSDGDPPFVIAGRFPNGAVAVAVQGRTVLSKNWIFPAAAVTLQVGSANAPVGVFGHYRSLTLRFSAPLGRVQVLAQDLAGERAEDITSQVLIKDNRLTLPGGLIDKVGLSAASQGDTSDPGLVLVIRKQT